MFVNKKPGRVIAEAGELGPTGFSAIRPTGTIRCLIKGVQRERPPSLSSTSCLAHPNAPLRDTMSYAAEFIFNIPSQFEEPADLAEWLNAELGLSLKPGRDGQSWDGPHIGLFLHFTPRHDMEAQPGLPYDKYRSSVGLTGYAGQGDLRVILLSAVINIALAMCFHSEFDGIIIWDNQVRIAHLGVNGEDRRLWDFDRQTQIKSFEDLKPIITHGVQY